MNVGYTYPFGFVNKLRQCHKIWIFKTLDNTEKLTKNLWNFSLKIELKNHKMFTQFWNLWVPNYIHGLELCFGQYLICNGEFIINKKKYSLKCTIGVITEIQFLNTAEFDTRDRVRARLFSFRYKNDSDSWFLSISYTQLTLKYIILKFW